MKKKLIALTICISFILSSITFAAEVTATKNIDTGVDVVAKATEVKPAPKPEPKPQPAPKPAPKPEPKPQPAPKSESKPQPKQEAQNLYNDGVYVAYGHAYTKGTEGAKVTIKNGKIANVELMRTSTTLIDREPSSNYKGLWSAYPTMKQKLKNRTRKEAQEVEVVSGATRSCDGWKLAVDRAFARALKTKSEKEVYFEGEHMGVDPQGKFMVFAKFDETKLLDTKVYPMEKGKAIDKDMNEAQTKMVAVLEKELKANGLKAASVEGYEAETKAAVNALWDAEQNAKIDNDAKYIDGSYSAYGLARDKGAERADIVIRNGKLVDVKLYRLGSDLKDRGNTAYESVVEANDPMVEKLLQNGSYFNNFNTETDAISGATQSSESWNLAIERAFEKAKRVPASKNVYFDGTFAGVDNESNVLVLVDISKDKVTKVTTYLFNDKGKVVKEEDLTEEQKDLIAKLNNSLLNNGENKADVKGKESIFKAAKAALADAKENASRKQSNYKDGTFTAYGDANKRGNNRVDVTLRNGKIIDIKLARVGSNYEDRGDTAYAEVIKAIPEMIKKFMGAATRENAEKVDTVSGATSSCDAFKVGVDRAFKKAEIYKSYKAPFLNGVHGGISEDKSVYLLVTVEDNIPTKMEVYYLDKEGKPKDEDKLTEDEKAVKAEIEAPSTELIHKYAYRPAAFGETESVKVLSEKAIEAIKTALETASY